jgi:chromosomal replication initiation ATPase DnaA
MKQVMTQSKDYFTLFLKERSKNTRLNQEIVNLRERYEREIASLKDEIINPKVKFKTSSEIQTETAISRMDLMNEVLHCICEISALTPGNILSRSREGDVVLVRHMYCHILRRCYHFTFKQIGNKLGRDHSTVIHAVNTFESWRVHDRHAKKLYKRALEILQLDNNGQSKKFV